MALSKPTKNKLVEQYRLSDNDTGSSDVQVAVLSTEIERLTEHLKTNKKDHSCRRGLMNKVGTRRSLLDYLARTDKDRYKSLIERLGLRR